LILGKGHEKYIITDGEISDFSEREIIERAFEKRKCGGI
jgi:UDP-N-acetylmuramyl tripeptide synthase